MSLLRRHHGVDTVALLYLQYPLMLIQCAGHDVVISGTVLTGFNIFFNYVTMVTVVWMDNAPCERATNLGSFRYTGYT